jgi:hypothetical protein
VPATKIYAVVAGILMLAALVWGWTTNFTATLLLDLLIGSAPAAISLVGIFGMWRLRWWGVGVFVIWNLFLISPSILSSQQFSIAWTIAYIIMCLVAPIGLAILDRRLLR